jgi:hypothetical protein
MNLTHKNKDGKRTSFPKPDRSAFSPRLTLGGIDWEQDIGWAEGKWNDGRPYRAELWSWEDLSIVTFFFSVLGLEDAGEPELAGLLEKESMVEFSGIPKVYPERVRDSAGNEMWSVSVPIREGKEDLVKLVFQLNSYLDPLDRPKVPRPRFPKNRIFALGTRKL